MLDQRPGLGTGARIDLIYSIYFRRMAAPGVLVAADIDDPNVRCDKIVVAYDSVELLIGEYLDDLAARQLDRIARIPADICNGMACDLAGDLIVDALENKKLIPDARMVEILKCSFCDRSVDTILAHFSFILSGGRIVSRFFLLFLLFFNHCPIILI